MQAEHFAKHEDRSPDRGGYADLTNFHAGSMISPGQSEHDGNQGRPDEHAQEAEGDETAKDAEDGQRHRHLDAKADQPRLDQIVDRGGEIGARRS
jgi:hypothetical protein